MSDWIEDEAEQMRLAQEKANQNDYLIAYSNYWADLTEQIKNDVQSINDNPVCQQRLDGFKIRIRKDIDGYKIEKTSFPAVYITLDNTGTAIKINTEIARNVDDSTKQRETLEVKVNGKRVYLVKFEEAFLIPEQASKYILKPILDVLKEQLKKG